MSDGPQFGALTCPACGGALLDVPASGVFRCGFCDAPSMRVDGSQLRVATRSLPVRHSAETARASVQAAVTALGLSPTPILEAHEIVLTYLARAGRAVVHGPNGGERRGVFGVSLPEGVTTDLLFVGDPSSLEPWDATVPDALAAALVHFPLRVQQALRAEGAKQADTSWEPEVLLIRVPALELSFSAPDLPTRRGRIWRDTRPDGRYRVVVDLARGTRVVSQLPWSGISPTTLVWILGAAVTVFLMVIGCPGLVGALVGGIAGVFGLIVGLFGILLGAIAGVS